MTWSDFASMIAAVSFAILVVAACYPLYQLGRTFKKTADSVNSIGTEVAKTVTSANETVKSANAHLARLDTVTDSAVNVAQDVSALTTLVSATVGSPLIKLNAFSQSTRAFFAGKVKRKEFSTDYNGRISHLRSTLIDLEKTKG
ncbi:DUF948 domain-containing protein [Actinomycetaceae bacterium TAE3-ERU4]|nr:DUF948 domain-containing protein [Actinomycetaceae bacterium TAE3-ERU4]